MFEEEEDDDEFTAFKHWNNWIPSRQSSTNFKTKNPKTFVYNDLMNFSSLDLLSTCSKYGNYIPPKNFEKSKNSVLNKLPKNYEENCENAKILPNSKINLKQINPNKWNKIINEDWGKRVELHDVSNCEDGEMLWGFVSLSSFTSLSLWVNKYNNICGCASGELLKPGSSEKAFISVTNLQLIRKLLNVTSSQWLNLCEAVHQSKACLKVETLKEIKLNEMSSLDKLWFFICNRRHFYPKQTMLVQLNGALKCMKELKIIPKLLVLNIRNEEGQNIL